MSLLALGEAHDLFGVELAAAGNALYNVGSRASDFRASRVDGLTAIGVLRLDVNRAGRLALRSASGEVTTTRPDRVDVHGVGPATRRDRRHQNQLLRHLNQIVNPIEPGIVTYQHRVLRGAAGWVQ